MFLVLAGLGVAAPGCGGGDEPTGVSSQELEGAIVSLPAGVSIERAKERLGEPDSEIRDPEGAESLFYQAGDAVWRITFRDGQIDTRSKSWGGPGEPSGKSLEATIRRFHRGIPIEDVETALGRPAEHEFEVGGEAVEVLWYGYWGLTFVDGRLDMRTRY
jgi:hypothetical protein